MEPDLFRHIVDSMADGIAVVDAEARVVYVNRRLASALGYEPEEIIGQDSRSFFQGERLTQFGTQLEQRQEGDAEAYEIVITGRSGDRLVRISPQPLFDGEGKFQGTFAIVTPVGEVRRAEIERQVMSEIARAVAVTDNLDELLELIHACLKRVIFAENFYIALYDPESEIVSFPYFVDQYDEVPEPERPGRTCTDFVLRTGEALLQASERFEELTASGEIELVGAPSPSWLGVPLKTPDRIIGVLAVQHYEDEGAFSERDLELCLSVAGHIALAIERRRADQALQESRQLLASVIESMSDGVIVLDQDFQLLLFSRAMERMARVSREEVIESGKPAWEHFPYLLEMGVAEMMQAAMNGEIRRGEEMSYWLPDGTRGFSSEIYQPLLRANGEIRGVLGVVRNVTDQVEGRKELQAKEEQLQHAQKMEAVGRLAGGIAHDFNNLLTAINGYAEIVFEDLPEDSPLRDSVKEIRDAGERAATLTEKLLALSRKQVVERRPVELNLLIGEFQPVLERLAGEHIELEMEPAEGKLRTELDPGQVEQVVLNLVVNALDAMPGGGRLVIGTVRQELDESSASHSVVPGPYVGFEIRDDGVGMSAEAQERLFEPFFTTKEVGKGTGLGLAIVYGIVKQSDGYVWAESEPGTGTTFRVLFPESGEGRPVSDAPGERPRAQGSETLMVVEDEPGVRLLISKILLRHGYRVIECADAAEALALFGQSEAACDLVITDVVMPRVSGPELAQQLARIRPAVKVLFVSGHLGETIESQGLIDGSELLPKPFSAEALVSKVRAMLDAGEATPTAPA